MKGRMKLVQLTILYLSIVFVESLKPCSRNVTKVELCTNERNYKSTACTPLPCKINPIFDMKDILSIDNDKNTITFNIYIILEWIDERIDFAVPEGQKAPKWYQLTGEDLKNVWAPNAAFLKVVKTKSITPYGKDNGKFDFWINVKDGKPNLVFYESLQVTTACSYDFSTFPFDDHYCHIDFGMPSYTIDVSVTLNPIKILTNTSRAEYITEEQKIPNKHLPFDFYILTKKQFSSYNYDYFTPFVGLTLHMKRHTLGSLVGSFYVPTAIFSGLSLISFFIKPDVVPGRMGLLVTLHLISSNVYGSLKAPEKRGFSYIEVWVLGTQGIILFAIVEYGLVLAWKKYGAEIETKVSKMDSDGKWKEPRMTKNEYINVIDMFSFIFSLALFLCFNTFYWLYVLIKEN